MIDEVDTDAEEPKRYSLEYKEVPIQLEHKDGQVKDYVLREFSGSVREQQLTETGNRTKMDGDGNVVGMTTFDGFETGLIARCLFEVTGDGQTKKVSLNDIKLFPATVQEKLADTCREICGLNKGAEDDAKNED